MYIQTISKKLSNSGSCLCIMCIYCIFICIFIVHLMILPLQSATKPYTKYKQTIYVIRFLRPYTTSGGEKKTPIRKDNDILFEKITPYQKITPLVLSFRKEYRYLFV